MIRTFTPVFLIEISFVLLPPTQKPRRGTFCVKWLYSTSKLCLLATRGQKLLATNVLGLPYGPKKTEFLDKSLINIDIFPVFFRTVGKPELYMNGVPYSLIIISINMNSPCPSPTSTHLVDSVTIYGVALVVNHGQEELSELTANLTTRA